MKFHKFLILYSKSIRFSSCDPSDTSQTNALKCSQFDLGNVRSLCINDYNFSLLIVRHLIISLHKEHRFTIIQCYFDFYLCSLSLFYLLLLISSNDNVFMLINVQKCVTKWKDTAPRRTIALTPSKCGTFSPDRKASTADVHLDET